MTDSLSRLILRAQGRLPIAEPLLPSRYAEAASETAWAEEYSETAALTPAAQARIPTPKPEVIHAATRDAAARPSVRGIQPAHDASTAAQGPPHEAIPPSPSHDPRHAETARSFAPTPNESVTQHRPPPPALRNRASPTETARSGAVERGVTIPASLRPITALAPPPIGWPQESIPDTERSWPAVRGVRSVQIPPARPTAAVARTSPTQPGPDRPADAPNVHISIGRVEVHAIPPQSVSATPPRPAPARRPTVSLTDYLADRGRAR